MSHKFSARIDKAIDLVDISILTGTGGKKKCIFTRLFQEIDEFGVFYAIKMFQHTYKAVNFLHLA